MPPQIYSAFIGCNTLYLAMQGVCHPFPLDSLKGCGGAEAIPIYCLCILATLRLISAQAHPQLVPHLPYRSRQHSHIRLECFPPQRTSVSVATASATSFLSSAIMYLRGAIIIYPMILPPCFSGGDFSLRLTLSRSQPRAKMARSAGENKKDPYFYIQVTERNTKKRTALVRLKR